MSDERWAGRPGPITPVASIGEHVLIRRLRGYHLYRILYREGLPLSNTLTVNFGAIAAGATLASQSLQVPLELNDLQLGQFRMRVLEDIRLTIWQPRSVGRFQVKNVISNVTPFTEINDPCGHVTEIFVYEDEWPFVDVNNPTGYNLALARAQFYGFRYGLDKIGEYTEESLAGIAQPYTAVVGEGY